MLHKSDAISGCNHYDDALEQHRISMTQFHKMHGLGNDFIILDEREADAVPPVASRAAMVAQLAHRHTGIGCDQLMVLQNSEDADCRMVIYNADGSESGACGNATRCVAWLLMRESDTTTCVIETVVGLLSCSMANNEQVSVNMGVPHCGWEAIPLIREMDTLYVRHDVSELPDGVAVNMGNPHLVLFVDDVDAVDLAHIGAALETSSLFPERANVNIAQIKNDTQITMKTWERGAGETLACGSGACATMVAARRRGLVASQARLALPGGELSIGWEGSEADQAHPVIMTGAASYVFEGTLPEGVWV